MPLIEKLSAFNRKERFHLIGQLLGNPSFTLDSFVLDKISKLLGIQIPERYFSAMDYHLDWIYASLELIADTCEEPKPIETLKITATQEDVDFLIAFEDENNFSHIVMIEAKGDTSFANKQIKSKSERLAAIFGKDGKNWENVIPHFLICSPYKPQQIDINELPVFMLDTHSKSLIWFELTLPNNQLKVTRCNQNAIKNQNGKYWFAEKLRQTES